MVEIRNYEKSFFLFILFYEFYAITKTITNHGNDYAMMIYNFLEF